MDSNVVRKAGIACQVCEIRFFDADGIEIII